MKKVMGISILCMVFLIGLLVSGALALMIGTPGWEEDTNRPGMDYKQMNVQTIVECQNACKADQQCKSFTLVKPTNLQSSTAGKCMLKNGVPAKKTDKCCTSGLKTQTQAQNPFQDQTQQKYQMEKPYATEKPNAVDKTVEKLKVMPAPGQFKKADQVETPVKQVKKDFVFVPEGSQIPAEFDDIMGVKVIRTSQSTVDVLVDYAAADHSAALMLGAILLHDGQSTSTGYVEAIIKPGKGQAVVKISNAVDLYNQVAVTLYTANKNIITKSFNYHESTISLGQVTKKSVTEYAIKVTYNLAVTSKVFLDGHFYNGDLPLGGWGSSTVSVTSGQGNAELIMNWKGQGTTPDKFNQIMVRLYSDTTGEMIASKTVNYSAAGSTVQDENKALDEIKNFKVVATTPDSLDFQVDYTYKSDQGDNTKVIAKVMSGGYSVDWLKCSQPYVQKGSGSAAITCNFGSAKTMPPGVYEMPSDQILVQLQGDNPSPMISKSFNFQKTWSLDDLSNFRITSKTDNEINFLVDYAYNSSHGALVGLGAKAIIGGIKSIQFFAGTQNIKKGTGTAAGKVKITPGGNPVEQVFVFLYESVGSEFFAKILDYPK